MNYPINQLQRILAVSQQGQLSFAIQKVQALLQKYPQWADAWHVLGVLYCRHGQFKQGKQAIQQAIQRQAKQAEYYFNLGNAYKQLGDEIQAINCLQQAVTYQPSYAQAWYNLGISLQTQKNYDGAIHAYQQAIKYQANYRKAYNNLAALYCQQQQYVQAQALYQTLTQLFPEYESGYLGLAQIAKEQQDFSTASRYYQQSFAKAKQPFRSYYNCGNLYREQGKFELAIQYYQKALQLKSDYALAHYALACSYLLFGQWQQGWLEYEWRWRDLNPYRNFNYPRWQGQDLRNKTVFVWSEQGVGDIVLFAQALFPLSQQAKQMILETDPRLIPIFKQVLPQIHYIPTLADINTAPKVDYHTPIGSLYRWYPPKSHPQAYLQANPEQSQYFQQKYQHFKGLKIGIAWHSGNPDMGEQRSMRLEQWLPMLQQANITWINLQYGNVSQELQQLKQQYQIEIYQDTDVNALENLEGFLAQINALDLVISIDNSTVHFAAAIGKPVWVLLPFVADWRWQLGREDCAWYPDVRLFRQENIGEWDRVVDKVGKALQVRLG